MKCPICLILRMYPGRNIKCQVDSILWAAAQGQRPISGHLPNTRPMAAPAGLPAQIIERRIRAARLRERANPHLALGGDFKGTGTLAK